VAEILEAGMVICFGLSWPMSILKSYKAGTVKGKSLFFLSFITLGYVCGIIRKIFLGEITSYVSIFYCINLCMLIAELILYARNSRLDRKRENNT
jgi:hypothetical protein